MNNSILDDFKYAWNKPNNAPAQLIIINVVIFLAMGIILVVSKISGMGSVFAWVYQQFSIPPLFSEFLHRPWTLITYGFAHSMSDIWHIVMNMLVFYWFSRIILEFLGNKKVIAIYVLGVIAGGVAYLLAYNFVPYFQDRAPLLGMVGASAAVYATVVAAAVFIPNYSLFLLFLGPVKIKYIAAFYVALSFLESIGSNSGGNIAHLGGAAMGWLYISQLRKGTDIGTWIIALINWTKSLFSTSPKIKVTHRSKKKTTSGSAPKTTAGKTKQEEIDAILDKISQSGYDSLSKEEKQKLFNASKN